MSAPAGSLAEDEPIWQVIQKCIVPLAFLLSFAALFICDRTSDRLAARAVLAFGYGWLLLVIWYGLLR